MNHSEKHITDIINQRFGKLVVLRRVPRADPRFVRWECKCDCGKVLEANGRALHSGHKKSCGCEAYPSGPKSGKWNPVLTPEERLNGRSYQATKLDKWREAVFKRDNYTCQICGEKSKYFNAHHLDGWHWAVDKRFDVDNGVTLCGDKFNKDESCHKAFHDMFGRGDNTREQYEQFVDMLESEIVEC